MENSRLTNATRNITWGVIEKVVMTLGPFLVRTVLIHFMGAEYLGLNSLFSSILQVLSLAELGVGSAINYSMYKPMAESDDEKICAILALYRKLYTIIGCVILVLGIAIMPFLPNLISGSYPSEINLYTLYLIYLINTVISYLMFAYMESLLLGGQRVDLRDKVMIIINGIMYIVQVVLIITFRSYYMYAIVIPIFTVISNLAKRYIVKKQYPQYTCRGKLSKEESKDIFKRVFALMISKISSVCRNSFDSIILSAFLGLVVVAKYQNYYYIVNTLFGFIGILNSAIVPAIGNSIVLEPKEKL